MTTHRMMPPPNGAATRVNGRSYACAVGATIDVPDFDADLLEDNGWTKAAQGGVGATAARPVNPPRKTVFHDSTLAKNIVWDGKTWRDPDSGAAV
jgi:hypothetical protein